MQQDWLFGTPKADFDTQEEAVAERLAADPVAASIADEEAEAFFAVAYLLRHMGPRSSAGVWRTFGVRVSHAGEKARRRATTLVLRRWKEPKSRETLLWIAANSGFGRYPSSAPHPGVWTEELFEEAYFDRVNVVWLARIRRDLGKAENLSEWLQNLDEQAERVYRFCLDVGRLTLRRIVYPEQDPARPFQEVAAGVQAATLAHELREKDRLSGALRQGVRRLEQDRKQLKLQARRAEREARAVLTQARGEVAAARKALNELLGAQKRELASRARMYEARLAGLQERIAAARAEFVRTLSAIAARSRFHVLGGRTVTVIGSEGDREIYRLLVESLGGRLAVEGGDVVIPAPAGFATFERQLRSVAMEQVLIKCDGLYRRKYGRPGIAMSGFQAYIGTEQVWGHSRVVCCGPTAGSLMAEYGAAAMALTWLVAAGPGPGSRVEIWCDCRTLVRRLARQRPARQKLGCTMLDRTVRHLVRVLRKRGCDVQLRWVPREKVHTVDRLCAHAYWDQTWYHRPKGKRPGVPLKAFFASISKRAG